MNSKSWWIGLAIFAAAAVYVAESVWHSDNPEIQSTVSQVPSVVPAAKDSAQVEPATSTFATLGLGNEIAGSQVAQGASVNGRWAGQIEMGPKSMVQFSFNLKATDRQLTGTASFPMGEASIQDGTIDGNRLSFTTQHRLPTTSQSLFTRFNGTLSNDVIALNMHCEGVESRLIVNRVGR